MLFKWEFNAIIYCKHKCSLQHMSISVCVCYGSSLAHHTPHSEREEESSDSMYCKLFCHKILHADEASYLAPFIGVMKTLLEMECAPL